MEADLRHATRRSDNGTLEGHDGEQRGENESPRNGKTIGQENHLAIKRSYMILYINYFQSINQWRFNKEKSEEKLSIWVMILFFVSFINFNLIQNN